jgi:hypothetical protein
MNLPATNDRGGRDERGRFALGNPGGPGRPRTRWRSIFDEVVSEDRFRGHIERVAELADSGERWALELVIAHKLGRPPAADADADDANAATEPRHVVVQFVDPMGG